MLQRGSGEEQKVGKKGLMLKFLHHLLSVARNRMLFYDVKHWLFLTLNIKERTFSLLDHDLKTPVQRHLHHLCSVY